MLNQCYYISKIEKKTATYAS